MKTFVDMAGNTWNVAVTADTLKRVKTLLNVNLLEITGGALLARLMDDPVLLCDVLYVICKPQADAADISDEAFGQSMGGDALEDGTNAFLDELVNICPRNKRPVLTRALANCRRMEALAIADAIKKIEAIEIQDAAPKAE